MHCICTQSHVLQHKLQTRFRLAANTLPPGTSPKDTHLQGHSAYGTLGHVQQQHHHVPQLLVVDAWKVLADPLALCMQQQQQQPRPQEEHNIYDRSAPGCKEPCWLLAGCPA